MKNRKLLLGLLMIILILAFFGCTKTPKLLSPSNLTISQSGLIQWDAAPDATGYRVTIGDASYTVADTKFQVTDTSSDFTFSVVSVAKGCEDSDPVTGSFTATVTPIDAVLSARSASVVINADEYDSYDFTKLFSLRTDTKTYPVLAEYLDTSNVSKTDGGVITCAVNGQTASINITVRVRVFHLIATVSDVTVYVDEALNTDYTQYFRATIDGETVRIQEKMVTSDVTNKAGIYRYSVEFYGEIKTVTVQVVDRVTITTGYKTLEINDYELDGYDFASLFSMVVNNRRVPVTAEYIDTSQLVEGGRGVVVCKNGLVSAEITVTIKQNVYDISLKQDEVTVHVSIAQTYDYLKFFVIKLNGTVVTDAQIAVQNNVKAQAGEYSYTVSARNASKTLTVRVSNEHQVKVVLNYPDCELQADKTATFDYTRLFALYVDEQAVKVTAAMVDASALSNAETGNTYQVVLTYTDANGKVTTATASVKVVDQASVTVTRRDVITYPNAVPTDLTSLFTVTVGLDSIPVTSDMISGSVDYSKEGDNVITLTYGDVTATATVKVMRGVVINVKSDVITVRTGTDIEKYFFEDDFDLTVNGVKIVNIVPFLDISQVNFAVSGEYTATLNVPYNTVGFTETASGKPTDTIQIFSQSITYNVTDKIAAVTLCAESVNLTLGQTFNPFSNVNLTINGAKQTFVSDKSAVNALCCYAEIEQNVDVNKVGAQQVVVKLYVDGPESDPQTVRFVARVTSGATLTALDKIIFEGDTLFTQDLFEITVNGEQVPVTESMISGHVDAFNAGLYTVTLNYQGASVSAKVVVLEQSVKGTYYTYATTIATEAEEDEEGWTTSEATSSRGYGPLIFDGDSIVADGTAIKVLSVIDSHTFYVMYGTNEYTMYMFDGIVVLNPDNRLKLSFSNTKRPLVYFNSSIWTMDDEHGKLVVSYASQHVLAGTITNYTIEVYTVQSKTTDETRTLALYIKLVAKTSADTIYKVSWGNASVNDGFVQAGSQSGILTYGDETFSFTMQNSVTGKVDRTTDSGPKYYGRFTMNGNSKAYFNITSGGQVSYTVNGNNIFTVSSYDVANMKNGGVDYNNNVALIYQHDENNSDRKWYSYKFLFDPANKKFTLVERDNLYGLYRYGDKYVYLDGYGTGEILFDAHSVVQLRYTFNPDNRELALTYFNNEAYPQYGSGATFYVLNTLNVLIGKQLYDETLAGKQFVNVHVQDGAIIVFNTVNITKDISRRDVIDYISIITKDGELTSEQKKSIVGYEAIDSNQKGVYQITVKVTVGGQELTCYYAVQAFMDITPTPTLAYDYGAGVINGSNAALKVDKYGLALLVYNDASYSGNVQYYGNERFVVRAKSASGVNVVIVGAKIADGIVQVACSGAVNFFDYFTVGTSASAGDGENYLRKITVDGNDTYVWAINATSTGSVASVVKQNSDVYFVTANGQTTVVKVTQWGNLSSGMITSDNVRGDYSGQNDATLTLDGFGQATLNGGNGSYVVNADGSVTFVVGNNAAVYVLNKKDNTFTQMDIVIDNTLLQGKTFGASYNFVCGSAPYQATTRFVFEADGKVTVITSSAEHDEGEDQCGDDIYTPPFAPNGTNEGTFSVTANKVTIRLTSLGENYVFTFEITDLVAANNLTCLTTSLDSDAHGYFSVGTQFAGYATSNM